MIIIWVVKIIYLAIKILWIIAFLLLKKGKGIFVVEEFC